MPTLTCCYFRVRVVACRSRLNVKYKETARGGLAVNIIEC